MEHLMTDHHSDRDLLAAALLHDCGKGRVPLWLRVAYVVAPWYVSRLADEAGPAAEGRPGAALRLVRHAELGAERARQAGSSETTVRYISGSTAEHEHDKIAVLRAADDRS
jgi:hypothetical protein